MKTTRTYFANKGEANGRMYDPVMSSFLSVDRYVQNPSNSQNFNRYSYCLNNPLKHTDPSGWQMIGGNMPRPSTWDVVSNVVYEPRDLGLRQLPEESIGICFPEEPEKSGGGATENPNGSDIWDPSALTPEQQKTHNKAVEFPCENSSIFKKLYDALSNSLVSYKLVIGETEGGVEAQFSPNDNTITFRDESILAKKLF